MIIRDSSSSESRFDQDVIEVTQRWLEKAVIGLNLCPFAKTVHVRRQIRYTVSRAETEESLLQDLLTELTRLNEAHPADVDTTLLIHPDVLTDFFDYNAFLEIAEAALVDLDLEGQIQIASFHPEYQFAGTRLDDVENCTNRSPYPILHLLREASIDRAVAAFPDASDIFNKNIETMQRLGHEGWRSLLASVLSLPDGQKN